LGTSDNLESGLDDVPTHHALSVAVEGGAGGEDAGTALFAAERGVGTGDEHSGGAVSEKSAGDEVRDGLVVILPGERAELDREKQSVLVGKGADVVGGAGDSCSSGDTAQAEDGRALDVDREGQPVDQARVYGGAGDSGDRGEEDSRDVFW
jgi:hypothetical protein